MQLEPMSGPQMPVKVWRMSSELCYGSLCQVSDYGYPDFYLKTEYSLLLRGRRRGITHRAGSCAHCNALALFFGVEVTSRCLIWNIHPKLLKVFFKNTGFRLKKLLKDLVEGEEQRTSSTFSVSPEVRTGRQSCCFTKKKT